MRTWVGVLSALGLLTGGVASAAGQAENLAFVDATATQVAVDQASVALAGVLSYEYRKLDENAQLATDKGTERYVRQHTELINKSRATANRQRHTVVTKVVALGVRDLKPDTARLVAFLDQTTTRGDTNKAATTGYAAVVDLRLVDGHWRLDSVSPT
jgi:Mce-associated membrane protein